ncbi:MAG: hypothetical protein KatS3mg032_2283 [Cyclobacteriaceae bacterium]|nr:MAG: hypothetical protein KatS3mg032_2283 [Cyclobacteriaceae bacterium]
MDMLWLVFSFIAISACASFSNTLNNEVEVHDLIFKKYKEDVSAGTCKVTAEVRHKLPNGKMVRYTLQSEKKTCSECEEDIRKGYEALKRQ